MIELVPVIQATLAPVFLISGAGIFLDFLQSRLFRVNDRIRTLTPEEVDDWNILKKRAMLLRNAILLQVLCIAFTVVTALFLIVSHGFGPSTFFTGRVLAVFSGSLLSFAASLGFTVQDTFLSVTHVERDAP